MTTSRPHFALILLAILVFALAGSTSLFPSISHALTFENGKTGEITWGDGNVEDTMPRAVVFGSVLWVFYLSRNMEDGYHPADIVYRTYDGAGWSARKNLTATPGEERDIALLATATTLCAVWITDDPTHTSGGDWDVVARAYTPRSGWGETVEITPANDTGDDYHPTLAEWGDGVVVFWEHRETRAKTGEKTDILARTWDPLNGALGAVENLTADFKGTSIRPSAKSSGEMSEMLWLSWVTNDTAISTGEDMDIVAAPVNVTADNMDVSLGEIYEVCSPVNTGLDLDPHTFFYGGKPWVIWETEDKAISHGDDRDLMVSFFNAAENTWEEPVEYTSPHDTGDDSFPITLSAKGYVFVVWNTDDPTYTSGSDWDILLSPINNTGLSNISLLDEVTPPKDGYDDGSFVYRGFAAAAYGGEVFVFWETKNPDVSAGGDSDIVYQTVFLSEGGGTPGDEGPGEKDEKDEKDGAAIDMGGLLVPAVIASVAIGLVVGAYLSGRRVNGGGGGENRVGRTGERTKERQKKKGQKIG